eukprot:TRINITY_DN69017_c0_g1_i1.p3 TRINITY_DN69017_c0_g1~~TRINITY_DN69017_c0_g1_i1.p3  ORF type:complete len:107 (+),score=0.48 TRINITY_DN69017_c0_g1_i1:23-343(+)
MALRLEGLPRRVATMVADLAYGHWVSQFAILRLLPGYPTSVHAESTQTHSEWACARAHACTHARAHNFWPPGPICSKTPRVPSDASGQNSKSSPAEVAQASVSLLH